MKQNRILFITLLISIGIYVLGCSGFKKSYNGTYVSYLLEPRTLYLDEYGNTRSEPPPDFLTYTLGEQYVQYHTYEFAKIILSLKEEKSTYGGSLIYTNDRQIVEFVIKTGYFGPDKKLHLKLIWKPDIHMGVGLGVPFFSANISGNPADMLLNMDEESSDDTDYLVFKLSGAMNIFGGLISQDIGEDLLKLKRMEQKDIDGQFIKFKAKELVKISDEIYQLIKNGDILQGTLLYADMKHLGVKLKDENKIQSELQNFEKTKKERIKIFEMADSEAEKGNMHEAIKVYINNLVYFQEDNQRHSMFVKHINKFYTLLADQINNIGSDTVLNNIKTNMDFFKNTFDIIAKSNVQSLASLGQDGLKKYDDLHKKLISALVDFVINQNKSKEEILSSAESIFAAFNAQPPKEEIESKIDLKQAKGLALQEKYAEAVQLFEKYISIVKEDIEKRWLLASCYVRLGEVFTPKGYSFVKDSFQILWDKSRSADARKEKILYREMLYALSYRRTPAICYDLACYYALENDKEKAFEYLNKAMREGYYDYEQAQRDKDLITLKDDNRFFDLMMKMKDLAKLVEETNEKIHGYGHHKARWGMGKERVNNSANILEGFLSLEKLGYMDNGYTYYNVARYSSLLGYKEDAIKYLKKAIFEGSRWAEDAENEKDFENIKSTQGYKEALLMMSY